MFPPFFRHPFFSAFLVFWMGSLPAWAQAPRGAVIELPAGSTANWAVPARIEMTVTGGPQSGFGWNGSPGGLGSNAKVERGSPYFSMQVEAGATFYRCDTVIGFPLRLGNSPPINRRGGSSFIAVKPTPKGGRKIWICASVGAYRIVGSAIAEWEYQVRYYSGDPDAGGTESLVIGTVPNADVFTGETPGTYVVTPDFLGVANLSGSIGDRLLFRSGYVPNALGTVSVLVTNSGSAAAQGSLDVHFYYSEDPTLSKTTDIPLGSVNLPSINIPPSGTLLVSSDPVRLPASLPNPPVFYFLAELKPSAAITETNVSDNVVAALPLLPGLSIDLNALNFTDARPGRTGAVEVILKNWGEGTLPAGPVELDLRIHAYSSRRVVNVPEIPPKGSSTHLLEDFVIPEFLFETVQNAQGIEYEVRVDLDPDRALKGVLLLLGTSNSKPLLVRGYGIRGRVLTVRSHRPVAEVKVTAHRQKFFESSAAGSAMATVITAEDGSYEFAGLPHESYIVVAQRENWAFSALDDWVTHRIALLDAFPAEMMVRQGDVTAFDYFGFGKMVLRSARTEYRGTPYFLSGVGHSVDFLIDVDWGSEEPGEVIFTQGSLKEYSFEAKAEPFEVNINVGHQFEPCVDVMVQAISADDVKSEKLTVPMIMLPKPSWPPVGLTAVSDSDPLYYKSTIGYDIDLLQAVEKSDAKFKDVPAADSIGIRWLPRIEMELRNDQLKGQLTTSGGFELLKRFQYRIGKLSALEFSPFLELEKRFDPGECEWVGEKFSAGVKGAPPSINFIHPLPIPYPVFMRVTIKGELGLSASWSSPDSDNPSFQVAVEAKATGRLSVEGGIPYVLSAGGFGELEVGARYEAPPYEWVQGRVSVQVGLVMTLLGETADITPFGPLRWEQSFPEPAHAALAGWPEVWPFEFGPMDRSYLSQMALPRRESSSNQGRLALLGAEHATPRNGQRVHALVTQGHPESHAHLEVAGSEVWLGWVMDDARRPARQRTLAVTSLRNSDGVWGDPIPIWDDGTADFHPRLRSLPDGTVFATWEDLDASARADATIPELMAALEISAARWDATQRRWMDQKRLTLNHQFDRSPRMVVNDRGQAFVLWIRNAANDLVGSAAAPNDLMMSSWTPGGWSDPSPVARVPFPIVYFEAGPGPQGIQIIVSIDTDGNLATTEDYELFSIEETAGAWSPLQRLTTDNIADQAPQFAAAEDGEFSLVWLRGNELSVAPGLNLARRVVGYTAPEPAALTQFRVASNGGQQLAVSWVEPSSSLADLVGVFYDRQSGTWSNPIRMTEDPEVERGHDAALLPTGTWISAYNRVAPPAPGAILARAVTAGLMGVPRALPGGSADLVVQEVSPNPNLALLPGSLRATPLNPGPGSLVSVEWTATNLTAWPSSGSSAVLYLGVPDAGGVELGRTNLGVLVGGGSARGTISWRIPVDASDLTVSLRLQSGGPLPDIDPSNNTGSLSLSRADLAMNPLLWTKLDSGRYRISAEVVNLGVVPSAPAVVRFNGAIDPITGSTNTAIPALAPGERLELLAEASPAIGADTITVTASLQDLTHPEFDDSNHSATTSIRIRERTPIRLSGSRTPGGGFEIRFRATPGIVHVLEVSTDLARWSEVMRSTPATADALFLDDPSTQTGSRFYRVRTESR